MAYEEAPHNVFTGLGEPDSTKFNPETGDSSYHYSGTVPKGIQSILGTISGIGGLLGFGGRGVTEGRPPPANMNNLEQPINNVSSLYNPNDSNQTQMANESYDPSIQPLDPNGVSEDPSIQPSQKSLVENAIGDINTLFSSEEGGGYADVGNFMKNMAAAESNVGQDPMGEHSYSAFQIDPIKYRDIVERAEGGGKAGERAQIANKYLREQLGDENFDILNLFQGESTESGERYLPNDALSQHSPLIGAALTRMGLANQSEAIPSDLAGQADYWKRNWNTQAGAGTPEKFMKQSRYHYPQGEVDDIMNGYNRVGNAFNY